MQQGSHPEFDGCPGGSARQCASDFMRKTVWRPAALAELKRLFEYGLCRDHADFLPVVGSVEIAVPTFLQILWIEVLWNPDRRLCLQHSSGEQQSDVPHQATTG